MPLYTLKDPEGDNVVTAVVKYSDERGSGYKIEGANYNGQPRSIIVYDNGDAVSGFNKSTRLGVVESQMLRAKDEIFKHFRTMDAQARAGLADRNKTVKEFLDEVEKQSENSAVFRRFKSMLSQREYTDSQLESSLTIEQQSSLLRSLLRAQPSQNELDAMGYGGGMHGVHHEIKEAVKELVDEVDEYIKQITSTRPATQQELRRVSRLARQEEEKGARIQHLRQLPGGEQKAYMFILQAITTCHEWLLDNKNSETYAYCADLFVNLNTFERQFRAKEIPFEKLLDDVSIIQKDVALKESAYPIIEDISISLSRIVDEADISRNEKSKLQLDTVAKYSDRNKTVKEFLDEVEKRSGNSAVFRQFKSRVSHQEYTDSQLECTLTTELQRRFLSALQQAQQSDPSQNELDAMGYGGGMHGVHKRVKEAAIKLVDEVDTVIKEVTSMRPATREEIKRELRLARKKEEREAHEVRLQGLPTNEQPLYRNILQGLSSCEKAVHAINKSSRTYDNCAEVYINFVVLERQFLKSEITFEQLETGMRTTLRDATTTMNGHPEAQEFLSSLKDAVQSFDVFRQQDEHQSGSKKA